MSGTVAALGPGVTAFAVGDRVLGRVPPGSYAELVVAPLRAWARVPAKLDLADAGALPLVLLTGAQLAEEAVDARAGETILVTGATGGVGRVAVFAAKARGAKVWAGVRGKYKAAAQALGADGVVVLDDGGGDLAKLPALDGIANTIFGDAIQPLLGKLKPGGKIGSVVGAPAGATERGFVVQRIHDARRSEAARRAGAGGRGRQAGHPDREALPARRGARGPRARRGGRRRARCCCSADDHLAAGGALEPNDPSVMTFSLCVFRGQRVITRCAGGGEMGVTITERLGGA